MKSIQEILKEHLLHPRRRGELSQPDGTGIIGNATCGDILSFQIKVQDHRLKEVRFQCLGCGAAKAMASYIAELAEGKTLEEIERLKMEDLFEALKALPRDKWHCPFQALDALKMAIQDFKSREHEGKRKMIDVKPIETPLRCPYCLEILGENPEVCESCEMKPSRCQSCGKEINLDTETK